MVDEIRLIIAGSMPFWGLSGRKKGREVVEPELGHSVERGRRHVVRMGNRMTLDEPEKPRDPAADWAVYLVPVA